MGLSFHQLIQVFIKLHRKVISFGENDKSKVPEWHKIRISDTK